MKNFHPVSVAVFFAAMVIPLMLVNNPLYTAVSAAGALILLCTISGIGNTLRSLWGFPGLFIIIALLNPLFVHRGSTPLLFLNGKAITLEAILYGLNSSFGLITAVLWCRGFSLVMTSEKMFCIIGRFSPKIAAMLMMTVRFIPDMLGQAKKIRSCSRFSGEVEENSPFGGIKLFMGEFSALVTWSIENAVQTADSMTARGFELGGRTSYSVFRFKAEDTVLCALSVISCTAALLSGGDMNVQFYPVTVFPDFGGASAAVMIICAVCCMYPAVFEHSVRLRRKYTAGLRGKLMSYENN